MERRTRPELPSERPATLGPDALLDVWRRRKWIGLVVAAAVLAGTITAAVSLPNLYRASATVLIERPQVSEAFVRTSVTAELETRIQTIHRQVMSRVRLTDMITRLDLYPELRGVVPMDALVERMRREAQLRLQGVEQSTGRTETIAFTLSYSGRDPDTVARVANTLAAFYVEGNKGSRERQATETAEFIDARLADVKRELDQQERHASELKLRQDNELQQVELSLTALERLNTQLRLNNESQMRALDRRERQEQQLADAESQPAVTPDPDAPSAQLDTLRDELAVLRRQYSEQYPEIIRVRAAIASLERQAAAMAGAQPAGAPATPPARRFATQAIANADAELRALKEEEASLRTQIARYEARVDTSPARQQQLVPPSNSFDALNDRYQALLKQAEDARLAENLERGQNTEQFRILDPALPPAHPVAPARLWLVLMGVAAAFALGFASIVVAEKFDTTFHTADDLQSFTNLPTLARIRLIPTAARARRERLRFALFTAAAVVGIAVVAAGTYYVAGGNEQIVRMTARPSL